jgi:hypothetical protein
MLSRISGSRRRAWIATKTASSSRPPATESSVAAEPQPCSGARTMPNTASASPPVAVSAPPRSIEPRRAGALGISPGVTASTSSAIGMLM